MSKSKSLRAALIGVGRLGHPFKKYLSSKEEWKVQVLKDTTDQLSDCSHLFLATPDSTLENLVNEALKINNKIKIVHFSGSFFHESAIGVHPVFSFPKSKVSNVNFKTMTYVVDCDRLPKELKALFPKRHTVQPKLKPSYHSFLSLTANFTQLLSHHYGHQFTECTGLPSSLLKSLMLQSLENEMKLGSKSFSGPWVRGEKKNQDQEIKKIKSKDLNSLNRDFKKLIKEYESQT